MVKRTRDFTESTKKRLAERAGFHCSFPRCTNWTIGADPESAGDRISTGEACHIYPASDAGARGELAGADTDRTALENGIWMCNIHGEMIDANDGIAFPPETLRKWRLNAEAAAALRQSGLTITPAIDRVEFAEQTIGHQWLRVADLRIEFHSRTLIHANDSMPLQMMATILASALEHPSAALNAIHGGAAEFTVVFRPGGREDLRIRLHPTYLNYWNGERPTASAFGAYASVLLNETTLREAIEGSDEVSDTVAISNGLKLDPLLIQRLAEEVKHATNIQIEELRIQDGRWEAHSSSHTPGAFFPLGALSQSEQLSAQLAIILARLRLETRSPSILIIDNLLARYDENNLRRFHRVCTELPDHIQVLVMDSSSHVRKVLQWPTTELQLTSVSQKESGAHYSLEQI